MEGKSEGGRRQSDCQSCSRFRLCLKDRLSWFLGSSVGLIRGEVVQGLSRSSGGSSVADLIRWSLKRSRFDPWD
jgi:hypothetical protein